jgi:uncharacterized protein (TIGR03437 family)
MLQKLKYLAGLSLMAGTLFAQPRITELVNGASYIPTGLPGSGVAQGAIAVIKGSNLGPAELIQSGIPRPTTLGGTSIRISVGGTEVSALMVYSSAGQLAFVLPSNTPLGNAVARVTYNGQTSDPYGFTVVRNGPGLFTLNSGGSGPAVLTNPNFEVLTYTNAAREGEVIIAWATGVTGITTSDADPAPAFDPPVPVEVFVGGRTANVRYRGRAPGYTGLDQIVFDVPQGVRGCGVSFAMRVGGNISNFTTIPVAGPNTRVCADPNGYPEGTLSNIPAGGLRIGAIELSRTTTKISASGLTLDRTGDSGFGAFIRFDANSLIRSRGMDAISYGSCSVLTFRGETTNPDPIEPQQLDAGAELTVATTSGTKTMLRTPGGYFGDFGTSIGGLPNVPGGLPSIPGLPSGGAPAFLEPGTYTVTGPGGANVGPFTARVTIPQGFVWTNQDATTSVPRGGQGLTVNWTGGNATDFVTVVGISSRRNPAIGAMFMCSALNSARTLRVPPEVLSALPPSETVEGTPTGFLTVSDSSAVDTGRFNASGLDLGYLGYSTSFSKNVAFE